jgi:catechol 2,3-dioxygenase-like lactoylglutathione lyase family enzyme
MSNAPFSIEHLDHVVLRTSDLEGMIAFYERLGAKVVRRMEQLEMAQLRFGSSMLDLVASKHPVGADAEAEGRNLDHFAVRVSPFDEGAILAFCAEHAIEAQAMSRLLGADGFGPAVYLRDPEGNRVELKGPPIEPPPDAPGA